MQTEGVECLTQEEDDSDPDSFENPGADDTVQDTTVHTEVSLYCVMGITSPKTLKIKGSVEGVSVVVMVDPVPLTILCPLSS